VTALRLPVSGLAIELRAPTGADDLLLAEAPAGDWQLALRLLDRLVTSPDGPIDLGALTVTDGDALLMFLRRDQGLDWLRANVACPDCGEPMEVAFSAGEYLEHHEPRAPDGVVALADPGWFALDGTDISFRLPRVNDLVELAGSKDAENELVRRCVRPAPISAPRLAEVEAGMEALAPSLSRELKASCPSCGHELLVELDVQLYCTAELRLLARSVFDDVYEIATSFHWPESEILALPRDRRIRYAELARSAA
jgi:predicted RNA-binding Zn-ribbon protein involved in translation (DUF1610 family)